jgi:hypothetical protein
VQDGVVLEKCSQHWCKFGTTVVVNKNLENRIASQVVPIGSTNLTTNCQHSVFFQFTQNAGEDNQGPGDCNRAYNGVYYTNILGSTKPWEAKVACMNRGMDLPAGCSGVPRENYEFVYTDSCACGHSYTLATTGDCKGYLFGWNDVRSYRCIK